MKNRYLPVVATFALQLALFGPGSPNAVAQEATAQTDLNQATDANHATHADQTTGSDQSAEAEPSNDAAQAADRKRFWDAARVGDFEVIQSLLEQGIAADAANDYGGTALMFASARGHSKVVKLLLEAKADPNKRDQFYSATPMGWAAMKGQAAIALLLLEYGSTDKSTALLLAVRYNKDDVAAEILSSYEITDSIKVSAKKALPANASEELKALFADVELPEEPAAKPDEKEEVVEASWTPAEAELAKLVATFGSSDGTRIDIRLVNNKLMLEMDGNSTEMEPVVENEFRFADSKLVFKFSDEVLESIIIVSGKSAKSYAKRKEAELAEFGPSSEASLLADQSLSSANWMQFRGKQGRGLAEGQRPPTEWNAEKVENVLWKVPIDGLAHSCPIIVGERIFLTTAIGEGDSEGIRTGLYGDVDSVEDQSVHQFKVLCLSKQDGQLIWERTAHTGKPAVKRHLKSTHANPTPASDGKHVVAFFSSEGLYCYDIEGNLKWKKDLGELDSGWFFDSSFQWGFAASPIIFENTVIVQCDIQGGSFICSLDIETGYEQWRTPRDEIPSWSTPTVVETSAGPQLVTNATHYARSYDPRSGKELWRIGKNSEIAVPTPFAAHDLIFVTSGYRPIQPVYAIRPEARGDLSLPTGKTSSDGVAWSLKKGGPYMPTPICYGDYLYTVSNSGILICYQATTGKRVYRVRLGSSLAKSFVGSPIAGDGHLYFPAESGTIVVVKAGPKFERVSENPLGESLLSSPAVSDGVLYVRGEKHLFAIGAK